MDVVLLGLLVAVLAVVALVALFALLAWLFGWDVERRLAPQRAALVEAGERTADRLADFRDWARTGR